MEPRDYKEELITAYECIGGLTKQVSDLARVNGMLVRSLARPEHARRSMREAFQIEQNRPNRELDRIEHDSLALIADAIRRLRAK